MTIDEDALRRNAAKYVDDPTEVDAFVESVKRRLAWRIERGYRTCSKCNENKKPGEFGVNPSRRDGLHHECRECRRRKSA